MIMTVVVSGSKHPTESSTLHIQLPVGDVYNHKQPAQFTRSICTVPVHTHSKQKKAEVIDGESAVWAAALYRAKPCTKHKVRPILLLNREHDEAVNLNIYKLLHDKTNRQKKVDLQDLGLDFYPCLVHTV